MKRTITILLVFLAGALPAWAALGAYEGSVGLDQQVLRGEMRDEIHTGYKVHQITTADNAVIVREFVSPEGKVFAISWRSRLLPNMQQLLGSYFSHVQQAAQTRVHQGGPFTVTEPDFVYVSAGRMMHFYGNAYVPSLLPKGVTAEVVR